MDEIFQKQKIIQDEIISVQQEMNALKARAASNSIHVTTGKDIEQTEVTTNIKESENLAAEMQPVRLEHVKLRKKLENTRDRWIGITETRNRGVDSVEICLENQVRHFSNSPYSLSNYFSNSTVFHQIFSEKSEQRDAELGDLQRKMNKDVIVLAHTKTKVGQLTTANDELEKKVLSETEELDGVINVVC